MARKPHPLTANLDARFSKDSHAAILSEWHKASDRVSLDPDGAVTSARSLVEAACKHVLDELGQPYNASSDLRILYGLASAQLGLAPAAQTEQLFRSVFGATHTVVQCIGEMRNKFGDAHGKSRNAIVTSRAQAELAVNLAGSVALFINSRLEGYLATTRRMTKKRQVILRFDKALVWRLVDHATNSPSWTPSYGQRRPKPALWLVGDAGIYLMSNGNPPISRSGKVPRKGQKPEIPFLTAPAEGCDGARDEVDSWWPVHNVIDDGSDFVIPIPINHFSEALEWAKSQIVIVAGRTQYWVLSDEEFDKSGVPQKEE